MSPVYLHALGMINALGADTAEIAQRLFAGATTGMVESRPLLSGHTTRIGRIDSELQTLPARYQSMASRNNRILCTAIEQIGDSIRHTIATFGAHRVGIVLGTSTSGIAEGEMAMRTRLESGHFPADYGYPSQEISSPSEFLRQYLGITGPAWTISTACTASAKAMAAARRLLQQNLCDAVIVGGVDSLCRMTLNGFDALGAIAPDLCLPLSAQRHGINIGEGAAVFIMSRQPSPVALLGVGETSDAYHISAPDPSGAGAMAAMQQALADADLTPTQIGYINLHGTATPQNDAMESQAVVSVFGDDIPCSSTKPLVGHILGAAGATEAGFCWLSLMQAAKHPLPPHVYDGNYDPALPALRLAMPQETTTRACMLSNSFAFGGSNASLVLGRI